MHSIIIVYYIVLTPCSFILATSQVWKVRFRLDIFRLISERCEYYGLGRLAAFVGVNFVTTDADADDDTEEAKAFSKLSLIYFSNRAV
jgi:hypothetical protein